VTDNIEIRFDLHPAQLTIFNDPTRFRVVAAGRRFGKTTLAIAEATCAALSENNTKRMPVYLIAPIQSQAKLLYWRPLINTLGSLVESTNVNEGLIHLRTGVMIGVKGADNPDTLRGPGLYYAVLDEYGSMKSHVWTDIVRPMLVDCRGRALFIGTPPEERNQFHKIYMEGMLELDPEVKSFTYESADNPFLPAGELEAARRSTTAATYNREYRAMFLSPSAGNFKSEWVKVVEKAKPNGFTFVTVDLAGFAGLERARTAREKLLDEHAIATTTVYPAPKDSAEPWCVEDIKHGRWGVQETAVKIVDAIKLAEPVAWGMEKGALYRAVLPYVRQEATRRLMYLSDPIPLSHENRVKTERILWALAGRYENGLIEHVRGPWNREYEDQLLQFPSNKVKDDLLDAVSYVAQISQGRVHFDISGFDAEPYWKPVDSQVGY